MVSICSICSYICTFIWLDTSIWIMNRSHIFFIDLKYVITFTFYFNVWLHPNYCFKFLFRGFTKFDRNDYLKLKSENRILADGVNAKVTLSCMWIISPASIYISSCQGHVFFVKLDHVIFEYIGACFWFVNKFCCVLSTIIFIVVIGLPSYKLLVWFCSSSDVMDHCLTVNLEEHLLMQAVMRMLRLCLLLRTIRVWITLILQEWIWICCFVYTLDKTEFC
jgi:hypothetical protein